MARNTNSVILTGHLGADPEIRQFQNGGQIAVLNLAVGDDYRDKQGNVVSRTHWVPVVIHGNYAEVARNYLHKGSKITVEGKLIQESWKIQNGETRTTLKVAAKMFEMLDGKPKADNQTSVLRINYEQLYPTDRSEYSKKALRQYQRIELFRSTRRLLLFNFQRHNATR